MSLSKRLIVVGVFCAMALLANGQTAAGTSERKATAPAPSSQPAQTPAVTEQKSAPPTEQKPDAKPNDAKTDEPKTAVQKPESDEAHSPEESIPTTTVFPESKTKTGYLAPELVPPALPKEKIALVGGTVKNIDQVRNRMQLQIFGAGKMNVIFDERTKFDRNGENVNQMAVKPGDRVYLDTQLTQGKIFARNVHIRMSDGSGVASASGQILSYNAKTGDVSMRDQISQRPVYFRVTKSTVIKLKDTDGTTASLQPNALISVRLGTTPGNRATANEVDVIALPGSQFTFYGTLTHLDLRSGTMAVDNKSDNRLYEIKFAPNQIGVTDDLRVGAEVAVVAAFNGVNYTAKTVNVNRAADATPPGEPKQ
ncbi:MAG: hypothetical protein JWO13_1924 [Acidobacteriales bacterium]|nr:hypothetical protein [Terriglobales bacterium]